MQIERIYLAPTNAKADRKLCVRAWRQLRREYLASLPKYDNAKHGPRVKIA